MQPRDSSLNAGLSKQLHVPVKLQGSPSMDNRQGWLCLKYFQPLEAMLKLQKRAFLCHLSTFVCTFSWAWCFSDEEFWNVRHNVQSSRSITIWYWRCCTKSLHGARDVSMFCCSLVIIRLPSKVESRSEQESWQGAGQQTNTTTIIVYSWTAL